MSYDPMKLKPSVWDLFKLWVAKQPEDRMMGLIVNDVVKVDPLQVFLFDKGIIALLDEEDPRYYKLFERSTGKFWYIWPRPRIFDLLRDLMLVAGVTATIKKPLVMELIDWMEGGPDDFDLLDIKDPVQSN
jgi:hypothetical protein